MTLHRIACAACGAPLDLPFVPKTPKLCEDCASGKRPHTTARQARTAARNKTWRPGEDLPFFATDGERSPGDEPRKDGAA